MTPCLRAAAGLSFALAAGCCLTPLSLQTPPATPPAEVAGGLPSAPPVQRGGWRPRPAAGLLLGLYEGAPVVGLGAKDSPRGLFPKRCLGQTEVETRESSFRFDLRPLELPPKPAAGEPEEFSFLRRAAEEAAASRPTPGAPEPVGLVLRVRAAGWSALDQASAELSPELRQLLEEGRDWEFFERCGTRYVQAARREASAVVFVALYPPDAEARARLGARVAAQLGGAVDEALSLGLLDELTEEWPSFLALRAQAGEVFDAVELGLGGPGRRAGRLVGNALAASLGAERGHIEQVVFGPWTGLPTAAALLREAQRVPEEEPLRRERLFSELKGLETDALDREALLEGAPAADPRSCRTAIEGLVSGFSWDGYAACRAEAWQRLPAALGDLAPCRALLSALDSHPLPVGCTAPPGDVVSQDPMRRSDTRYPLLLEPVPGLEERILGSLLLGASADRTGVGFNACLESSPTPAPPAPAPAFPEHWSQRTWDRLYRQGTGPAIAAFEGWDEQPEARGAGETTERGPLCIEPGAGGGGLVCLHAKGEEKTPAEAQADPRGGSAPEGRGGGAEEGKENSKAPVVGVSAVHAPAGERRWPTWQRLLYPILLSWDEPRPGRAICRGTYEVQGALGPTPGGAQLTAEAAELARKDLRAFYRACGTHRVAQVLVRRGFEYAFTLDSPGDLEVSVLPHGLSGSVEASFSRVARARDFIEDRGPLLKHLAEESTGLAAGLVLEPWSEVLLGLGVVEPRQFSVRGGR